jgi:Tfp pilus assembly protein PilF
MSQEIAGSYQGSKRALIISISIYDKLESLDFCQKDGNKIFEVLSQLGYNIPDKYKLIGGRIEYLKVRKAIMDFYDSAVHPKDTILFYFSGHGVLGDDEEHYLSSSEIDPDRPQGFGFSFDELARARRNCNSKTIFTILDCCYAGAATVVMGGKGPDDYARDAKKTISAKSNNPGEGQCILAACKPMQRAYEYKEQGHSFFTYYLTEALGNRSCVDQDGDVTPDMLSMYIDDKIANLPSEKRPKQRPFLSCSTSGKIVVAHYIKQPDKEKPTERASAANTAINEALESISIGDYSYALSCLDKALEFDPKNAKAFFHQGNAFAKLEKYQEAMKSYQKAWEIDPNPKYTSAVSRLLGMIAGYIEKKEKGYEPEAIDIHEKIQKNVDSATKNAEIEIADVGSLTREGKDLDNLGKHNEAIEYFDKAIKIDPNYADAWNNKGVALKNLGKHNEAIECYDKAIKIDPNYALAWNNKGLALYNLGKYNESIECYDKAIKIDPNYALARNNKDLALKHVV